MLPTPRSLLTVIAPPAIVQRAGDLSRLDTHSSRFFPSNRMMASEGGAAFSWPGVTIGGTGSHTSVSWGRPRGDCFAPPLPAPVCGCCATRAAENASSIAKVRNRNGRIMFGEIVVLALARRQLQIMLFKFGGKTHLSHGAEAVRGGDPAGSLGSAKLFDG